MDELDMRIASERTGGAGGAADALPARLGPYRVLGRLGEGGMGVVYRGHDETLDRPVALKVLPRTGPGEEGRRQAFEREARSIASVMHPNVVQVYAAGETNGLSYFAMELVQGPDLREVLEREGPLPADRARRYLGQAAQALRAAAKRGVLHRDVKPGNLLLDRREDQVKVADFGLARAACVDASLGGTSLIAGTPLYVAPEVIREGEGDARSDIYSLGATFFHLLAGEPPFGGGVAADALVGHATLPAPDLRAVRPDVDPALAAVVARCLEKSPAARFATWDDLLAAVEVRPTSVRLGSPARAGSSPAPAAAASPAAPVAAAPAAPFAPAVPAVPQPQAAPEAPERSRPARSHRAALSLLLVAGATAGVAHWGGKHARRLAPPIFSGPVESAVETPDEEPVRDVLPADAAVDESCEFAELVTLTRKNADRFEGDLLNPIPAATFRKALGVAVEDGCAESQLPFAVVGGRGSIVAWHVHDAKRRTVTIASADGTQASLSLGRFLELVKGVSDRRGKNWTGTIARLKPFLPKDAFKREIAQLSR